MNVFIRVVVVGRSNSLGCCCDTGDTIQNMCALLLQLYCSFYTAAFGSFHILANTIHTTYIQAALIKRATLTYGYALHQSNGSS